MRFREFLEAARRAENEIPSAKAHRYRRSCIGAL